MNSAARCRWTEEGRTGGWEVIEKVLQSREDETMKTWTSTAALTVGLGTTDKPTNEGGPKGFGFCGFYLMFLYLRNF